MRHHVPVGRAKMAGNVSPTTNRETIHAPVIPDILEKLVKQVRLEITKQYKITDYEIEVTV
ncbi:hypothetical protein OS493_034241 [Desmophyllum pertusum]|uniref:Uncharacterized protein n=1 Tax=Desmophyllum pertusum TaxID=174260 RepID=A0A9W9Z7X4_9CNID|nr:hypothetical protein OS493_034241 [Desmophyllum pertusum]